MTIKHEWNEALFEHRFWLQILGDHTRFIYNTLSPQETDHIRTATQLMERFDSLLETARRGVSGEELKSLTQEALKQTRILEQFKKKLLAELLEGKVQIMLPPTFINHMLNELEEYVRILIALLEGKPVPKYHPLHHHMLWLLDAAGHAASLKSDFDLTEKQLILSSDEFAKHFEGYYLKATELAGYLRTGLRHFPALQKFNRDAELEIRLFMSFLQELEEMQLKNEALDRIHPLMPDHMFREECYYLKKLSQLGIIPDPNCDPTKPRVGSSLLK
ncbi:DUF2935 domain-containing protein [Marinicrinis lubricantis]|uniref:DUF2935 domain-containing protein n=1 Tax=Marinicrinis lubricantis TaxID=2086470 RepID=A0ABW1IL85_9BACL